RWCYSRRVRGGFGKMLDAMAGHFFFSSRRRHTRSKRDWSSDVCSSDLYCDAAAAIEEVAGVLSHEAERRGLNLSAEWRGAHGQVAVSAEALNDILSNLVVNALEATPRGGSVSVNAVEESGSLCVWVEDDGPGIPAALREKVLQPFFTTKSQGTG